MNNKYVSAIRQVVKNYEAEHTRIQGQLSDAKLQFNRKEMAENRYSDYVKQQQKAIGAIAQDALAAVSNERDAYIQAVEAWGLPSGDKVHDDIKLLSGLIYITPPELERLAEKHRDNPTMQRALHTYADSNNIPLSVSAPTADAKRAGIESLYHNAVGAIQNPSGLHMAILTDDNQFHKTIDPVLENSGEIV